MADRLLELVGDDLLQLVHPIGCDLPEPIDESLVQVRTQLLRHRLLDSVSNKDVREPIAVVVRNLRTIGSHELLTLER